MDTTRVEVMRTGTDQSAHSSMLYHTTHQLGTVVDGAVNSGACYSAVPREKRWSMLHEQQQSNVEGLVSSGVASAQPEEVSDSPMFLRGRTISDSIGEHEVEEQEQGDEVMVWGSSSEPQDHPQSQPFSTSPAPNRLSKREKNRLKSQRRKQRRRERWINSQLEQVRDEGPVFVKYFRPGAVFTKPPITKSLS